MTTATAAKPVPTMRAMVLAALCATAVLPGCSSPAKNVPPQYVSPAHYQYFNCKQLEEEFQHIQGRFQELRGFLNNKASKDGALGFFGAIVFFPALFMVGGTETQEAEYAVLRGEYEALQQAAQPKNCTGIPAPDAPLIGEEKSVELPPPEPPAAQ